MASSLSDSLISENIWKNIYLPLVLLFVQGALSLYEDQIGKFDWRQQYIGKTVHIAYDKQSAGRRVIVGTEENVIAALNPKNGHLLWRHILEKGSKGLIQYLHVEDKITTVSGNLPLIRRWDPANGHLLSEWTGPVPKQDYVKWAIIDDILYNVEYPVRNAVQVQPISLRSGSLLEKYILPWPLDANMDDNQLQCSLVDPNFICLNNEKKTMFLLDITNSTANFVMLSSPLEYPLSLSKLNGPVSAIILETARKELYILKVVSDKLEIMVKNIPIDWNLSSFTDEDKEYILESKMGVDSLEMHVLVPETSTSIMAGKVKVPPHYGSVMTSTAICSARGEKGLGCRVMVTTEDHAVLYVQFPGELLWSREESLTSILAVEIVDLPISEGDVTIDAEFGSKNRGYLSVFAKRLYSQVLQMRIAFMAIMGLWDPSPSATQGLIRDEFGLHKIIVAATTAGKVFGIDNWTGEIIWQKRLIGMIPFMNRNQAQLLLFVQRPSRHYPYPAQCVLVGKQKTNGEGLLFVFNPISGQPMDGETGLIALGYPVIQASLAHEWDDEFIKGLLLLDDRDQVHVYPESALVVAKEHASTTYLFTADKGRISGFTIGQQIGKALSLSKVWEMDIPNQRIMHVLLKSPIEKVHSQGRVLGDRSVLYKYLNPNLAMVITEGSDPVRFMNVYLLDIVSGNVIYSINHKRVHGPVHAVHSENWMVYSFYNEKKNRVEIASLELYEGLVQSNETAFSSFSVMPQPIVETQAFILPSGVEAMKETITEKGITSKHILVALSQGGITELPRFFLDPRRQSTTTMEMREEGIIPYIPELPIHHESLINYNQTLQRVRGIQTVPSGLESTCLVLVYGLDMYYTRVTPSKNFDVLKDDFDHFLIAAVLVTLMVATYITKRLAARKALKQAWK